MPMDDRPAELRLQSLEAAVLDLTVNVRNLVDALQVVGELSAAQHEQATRQIAGELRAKEEHDLAQARFRRVTMVQRVTAVTVAIAVPAVSIIAYWSLTVQVNQEFTREQNDLTNSCELRNNANVFIPRRRELALAAAYATSDPAVAKIHQDSADALAKVVVDCSLFTRKEK